MYDDTAEIRSMEWEWMDRKRRESSNSQGTLGAWDIKKTKKGYLFLPFITYIIIYNFATIWNWAVSVRVRVPCLPVIHTCSTMIYNIHCGNTLVLFVPLDLNL